MRKFIFRAWLENEKRMIDDDQISLTEGRVFERIYYPDTGFMNAFPRDKAKLMQYTGLKDRNGKVIFEGDILADIRHTNVYDSVQYKDGQFICTDYPDINLYDCLKEMKLEVVGNIYENPELI